MRATLVALCALLAGIVAVESQQAAPDSAATARAPAVPAAAPASAAPAGAGFAFADRDYYGAIVERPLFHPSRRPARGQAKTAPAAGHAELLLTGVLIMANRKLALLQQAGSPDIIRLQPGAELDDWVLTDVAEDRITLRRGAESRELRLQR